MRSLGLSLLLGVISLGLLGWIPSDAEAQRSRRRTVFISPAPRYYYPPMYSYYYPPRTYYYPAYRMPYGSYGYSQMPYGGYGSYSSPYGGSDAYSSPYGAQDSYSSPSYSTAPEARTTTVGVYDNYFLASTINISVGTTVLWTNYGRHAHTITSDTNLWNSVKLNPRDVYGYTFTQPGTYPYHCAIHPQEMKGVIAVK